MAKSIQEYENIIDAQIAAKPELASLGTGSNVALFKGFRTCVAFVFNLLEQIFDDFKAYVDFLVNNKQYGTVRWWHDEMLKYQHGDLLFYLNNKYQYPAIDANKNVVKLCSVSDKDRKIRLKIASVDANGIPVKLPQSQIDGAQSYAEEKRPAGTYPICQSYDPDLLKIRLKVFYNPQAELSNVITKVESAILNYINRIDFDGVFYVTKLTDAIQALPFIIDNQVFVIEIEARPDGGVFAPVPMSYQAEAGYFKIDPGFPLSTNLQYVPV